MLAIINAVAGYLMADEGRGLTASLVPLFAGGVLAAWGFALAEFRSRIAGVGLLVTTVAILVARWYAMGRPGPLVPGLLACYAFWQGLEAAGEWARLREYTIPADGPGEHAI